MSLGHQPSAHSSHPYTSSISSSASSSSSSIFSVDGVSQASSVSSAASTQAGWDARDLWTLNQQYTHPKSGTHASDRINTEQLTRVHTWPSSTCRSSASNASLPPLRTANLPVPAEQRQHPRRSSSVNIRPPPALVRQSERKVNFVDSLVVSATQMVEVIWPLSVPTCPLDERPGRGVLPLRTFIQETLRRSRTSYSTLQVALYYLILIKSHVPDHDFTMEQPEDMHSLRALQCGRRMFLAALILASKYLQDRNFSSRAWSKISGLKVCEINTNEMAFLHAVKWKLHITEPIFDRWQQVVLKYTPTQPPSSPGGCIPNAWRGAMALLTPELDTIELNSQSSPSPMRVCAPELSLPPRSPLGFCGSQEATPTPSDYKLPRFLEPKPEMLPPTPSLARLGTLPTPMLTPQSAASATPAASGMAFSSRRPSMCPAMAQAQCNSYNRSTMDWAPHPSLAHSISRRPSMAFSSSLSSSPESMISDNSSRSSRASSISSVSSSGWAPNQANLARLATCRSARLPYPGALARKRDSPQGPIMELASPEIETFHMDEDVVTGAQWLVNTPSKPFDAAPNSNSRKRGRSSVDLTLQQNVRNMLADRGSPSPAHVTVLPDRSVARSFLLDSKDNTPMCLESKAMQSPTGPMRERRIPIQKEFSRKRCCASEAALLMNREQRPGMWEGIL